MYLCIACCVRLPRLRASGWCVSLHSHWLQSLFSSTRASSLARAAADGAPAQAASAAAPLSSAAVASLMRELVDLNGSPPEGIAVRGRTRVSRRGGSCACGGFSP